MVASWLVRATPDRVVGVRGPGRGHCVVFFTLTVPLSTHVYNQVPANLMLANLMLALPRNRDKLRPDGPLGSYADFTLVNWAIISMGKAREIRWTH